MSEAESPDEGDKKVDRRIGNQFWLARSTHGANPKFKDGPQLWSACLEYFQWVEDNPLWENKVTQYQGVPIDMEVAKMRPMTIGGLCLFLDITQETWCQYRKREDLSDVTKKTDETIYQQKFAGATADLFNANIIARDLRLKDSTETKVLRDFEGMSDDELALKKKELERELGRSTED